MSKGIPRKRCYTKWPRIPQSLGEGVCQGTRGYTHVEFTLGYPKKGDTSRRMVKEIDSIKVGKGNPEWGAPEDKEVFIIKFK